MSYDPTNPKNGWRNMTVWLSPEAVQALENLKIKNGQVTTSEVVSQCLIEAENIHVETNEKNTIIAGILERLESLEDERDQFREEILWAKRRDRTRVNKVELVKAVAQWMVRNNNLTIKTVDYERAWKNLKEQNVVVHATYINFRLWCNRNKEQIKAQVRKAL